MYNMPQTYPYSYYANTPAYNPYAMYQCPYISNMPMYSNPDSGKKSPGQYFPYPGQPQTSAPAMIKDYGPEPFVVNIDEITRQNNNFRTALWTGKHLQLTLMSINIGEDIGLEIHPNLDQFIRIEEGQGVVMMGDKKDKLDFQANVRDDYAFIIPAGKWHNLVNTGKIPLKLYSIYAPPQHPHGTVHATKAIAEAAEEKHHH